MKRLRLKRTNLTKLCQTRTNLTKLHKTWTNFAKLHQTRTKKQRTSEKINQSPGQHNKTGLPALVHAANATRRLLTLHLLTIRSSCTMLLCANGGWFAADDAFCLSLPWLMVISLIPFSIKDKGLRKRIKGSARIY